MCGNIVSVLLFFTQRIIHDCVCVRACTGIVVHKITVHMRENLKDK